MKRYEMIALTIDAYHNCLKTGNAWADKHRETLLAIMRNTAPSGSGIDNGTRLDFGASSLNKLVFATAYHHMNENGFYDEWTEHVVTAVPSFLSGLSIRISGRNRNEIKDYLYEVFHYWLTEEETPLETGEMTAEEQRIAASEGWDEVHLTNE